MLPLMAACRAALGVLRSSFHTLSAADELGDAAELARAHPLRLDVLAAAPATGSCR